MRFLNFASSSSGNCHYLELNRKDRETVRLLIEAGISYKDLLKKCINDEVNLANVDAVLVTHQHNDHCLAVKDLKSVGKRVYANRYITSNCPKTTLESGTATFIAPDTKVVPFEVEHDVDEPLGFIITTGLETVLFVNDCKYFKSDLSKFQFDYIFIESNYDGQVVYFAYENAKKDKDYQNVKRYERLKNAHMSNAQTVENLKKMDLSKCKGIFLLHLSDRHANEYKFKQKVAEATGVKTYVCKKNGGVV